LFIEINVIERLGIFGLFKYLVLLNI